MSFKKIFSLFMFIVIFVSSTSMAKAAADITPDTKATRSSIPKDFKWDLSVLFKDDGAWEKGFSEVESKLKTFSHCQENLKTAQGLNSCLEEYFIIRRIEDSVGTYANSKNVEDEENQKYNKMHQRAITLEKEFQSKTSFLRRAILSFDDKLAATLIADESLAKYRNYIEEMRRRKSRLLTPEAEKVMNMAGDNILAGVSLNEFPSDVELIFKSIERDLQFSTIKDETGKEVQLDLANYSMYRASKDRRVRKDAVEGFFGTLKKYQNILASTLGAEIKRDVLFARAHNYNTAVEAYLDRDQIDSKVVDNLINAIHENLKPLHRYVKLRKKLLGLKDVHIYDLYTPIVPSVDTKITYSQTLEDIMAALKPLGKDYLETLAAGVKPGAGWVDVYPNKGKESGAFATFLWHKQPFVKLNYLNDIDDALTAAHEFGHAMHFFMNDKARDYVDFGTSNFTAEIASTFNELMLLGYLTQKYKDDAKTKLYLLGHLLESLRTTMYRQTLFAEFEKKVHGFAEKNIPITAELLNKTYKDLLKLYYGPDLTIGVNDDIEWSYIPHLYWKFYVYTYATGIASAVTLENNVIKEGDKARDRYFEMLKAPAYADPVQILKDAGVDLTKSGTIKNATDLMDKVISEMEKIASDDL